MGVKLTEDISVHTILEGTVVASAVEEVVEDSEALAVLAAAEDSEAVAPAAGFNLF